MQQLRPPPSKETGSQVTSSSRPSSSPSDYPSASKTSAAVLSPRRPPPQIPDFLLTGSLRGTKLKPRHDPEPWEPEGLGTPSESHVQGNLWFDLTWKARTVALSPDQQSASWRNSRYGGFIASHRLRKSLYGRFFEVRIERVEPTWSSGFGIGLGPHPSNGTLEPDVGGFYEGLAWESMPCWMLGYDARVKIRRSSRYLNSREMLGGRWQPSALQCGDRVGLLATHDGHLMLFVNDQLTYLVTHCATWDESPLHGLIDLDGSVQAVRLLDKDVPGPKILEFLGKLRETEFQRSELLKDLQAHEEMLAPARPPPLAI